MPELQTTVVENDRLSSEAISKFNAHGYLILQQLLSAECLEPLRKSVCECWDAKKGKDAFHPEKTWLQNALFPNVHHYSEAARDYYWNGPLVPIMTQLISPNVKASTCQLTFKMKGHTQNFEWHQDNGYGHLTPYNSVSCLLALDDVTLVPVDNGCLRLIPGSHKRGQLADITPEEKASGKNMVLNVEEDGVPVPMRAGDVLLMHCHMLHRSMGNLSDGHRRILFCRYSDADSVEVYNGGKPRLGKVVAGISNFTEVNGFEQTLELKPLPADSAEDACDADPKRRRT